jgi:hypothetical protein
MAEANNKTTKATSVSKAKKTTAASTAGRKKQQQQQPIKSVAPSVAKNAGIVKNGVKRPQVKKGPNSTDKRRNASSSKKTKQTEGGEEGGEDGRSSSEEEEEEKPKKKKGSGRAVTSTMIPFAPDGGGKKENFKWEDMIAVFSLGLMSPTEKLCGADYEWIKFCACPKNFTSFSSMMMKRKGKKSNSKAVSEGHCDQSSSSADASPSSREPSPSGAPTQSSVVVATKRGSLDFTKTCCLSEQEVSGSGVVVKTVKIRQHITAEHSGGLSMLPSAIGVSVQPIGFKMSERSDSKSVDFSAPFRDDQKTAVYKKASFDVFKNKWLPHTERCLSGLTLIATKTDEGARGINWYFKLVPSYFFKSQTATEETVRKFDLDQNYARGACVSHIKVSADDKKETTTPMVWIPLIADPFWHPDSKAKMWSSRASDMATRNPLFFDNYKKNAKFCLEDEETNLPEDCGFKPYYGVYFEAKNAKKALAVDGSLNLKGLLCDYEMGYDSLTFTDGVWWPVAREDKTFKAMLKFTKEMESQKGSDDLGNVYKTFETPYKPPFSSSKTDRRRRKSSPKEKNKGNEDEDSESARPRRKSVNGGPSPRVEALANPCKRHRDIFIEKHGDHRLIVSESAMTKLRIQFDAFSADHRKKQEGEGTNTDGDENCTSMRHFVAISRSDWFVMYPNAMIDSLHDLAEEWNVFSAQRGSGGETAEVSDVISPGHSSKKGGQKSKTTSIDATTIKNSNPKKINQKRRRGDDEDDEGEEEITRDSSSKRTVESSDEDDRNDYEIECGRKDGDDEEEEEEQEGRHRKKRKFSTADVSKLFQVIENQNRAIREYRELAKECKIALNKQTLAMDEIQEKLGLIHPGSVPLVLTLQSIFHQNTHLFEKYIPNNPTFSNESTSSVSGALLLEGKKADNNAENAWQSLYAQYKGDAVSESELQPIHRASGKTIGILKTMGDFDKSSGAVVSNNLANKNLTENRPVLASAPSGRLPQSSSQSDFSLSTATSVPFVRVDPPPTSQARTSSSSSSGSPSYGQGVHRSQPPATTTRRVSTDQKLGYAAMLNQGGGGGGGGNVSGSKTPSTRGGKTPNGRDFSPAYQEFLNQVHRDRGQQQQQQRPVVTLEVPSAPFNQGFSKSSSSSGSSSSSSSDSDSSEDSHKILVIPVSNSATTDMPVITKFNVTSQDPLTIPKSKNYFANNEEDGDGAMSATWALLT